MLITRVDIKESDKSFDKPFRSVMRVTIHTKTFICLIDSDGDQKELSLVCGLDVYYMMRQHGLDWNILIPYIETLNMGESCLSPIPKQVAQEIADTWFKKSIDEKCRIARFQLDAQFENTINSLELSVSE